jgi:hypothetical protein
MSYDIILAPSAVVFAIVFREADPPFRQFSEVERSPRRLLNALGKCLAITPFDLVTSQPYFVEL